MTNLPLFDLSEGIRLRDQGISAVSDDESWVITDEIYGYEVSSHGRVRSFDRNIPSKRKWHTFQKHKGQLLRPHIMKNGYHLVYPTFCRKRQTWLVHRLVAKTFIPNPYNKPEINHKDGDKSNNHYSNLEWVSASENQLHSFRVLKRKIARAKKITAHDPTGTILFFNSLKDAERDGFGREYIRNCLKNKNRSYRGYYWRLA